MEALIQLDEKILLFIQEYLRQEWMDPFWKAVTHLGDGGWLWILLGVGLLIFPKTRRAGITVLLALAIGAVVTNVILKNIVARIRPYEMIEGLRLMIERQHDFSFPSGHTCASFSAAVAIFKALPHKFGIPAIVLATLISLSRLYVGVHYPTDIAAGLVIGILSGWTAWMLVQKYETKKSSRSDK